MSPEQNLIEVISEVAARRDEVVEKVTAAIRASIPGYETNPDEYLAAELAAHVRDNVDVLLGCAAEGRTPVSEDLRFIRTAMERRVDQGVPLEDVLQAFRTGLQAFWETIIEVSARHPSGSDAALMLALPAMQYIDVASSEVTESYLRIEERMQATANRAQLQVLRALLEGRRPDEDALNGVAGTFKLKNDGIYLVVVALEGQESDVDTVRQSLEKFGRRPAFRGSLIEADAGRVTAIIALGAVEPEPAALELKTAMQSVGAPVSLRFGVGIPAVGLPELPQAHREAVGAARLAAPGEPVVMPVLGVVARTAVMMRTAGNAERMVPPEVERFLEEDRQTGDTLTETVLVYSDCDLNARRAADRLFVHANTVLYRLGRVAERSGLDPRIAQDLHDLVAAMSLRPFPDAITHRRKPLDAA